MLREPKDTEETREKKTEEVIEMQAIASASQKEMEIICALSVLIFLATIYIASTVCIRVKNLV